MTRLLMLCSILAAQAVAALRVPFPFGRTLHHLNPFEQMSKLENLVATHSTFRKNASPAELQVAQAELNRIRATVMRMQRSGSPRVELQAEPGSSSSPQVELQAELLAEAAAAAAEGKAAIPAAAAAAKVPPPAAAAPSALELKQKLGRDPRLAPPELARNATLLAEIDARSVAQPVAAFASTACEAVGSLQTLDDFESALAAAAADGKQLVVVKFYAPRCRACLAARPKYEALAKGPLGLVVNFHEVDFSASRALCALARVLAFPSVHVYEAGKLVDTRLVSHPDRVAELEEALMLRARGFRA